MKFSNDLGEDGVISVLTLHEPSVLQVNCIATYRFEYENVGSKVIPLEGDCQAFGVHSSGFYVIASVNTGGIYIIAIKTCDTVGVIKLVGSPANCLLDPSGLFVGVTRASTSGVYSTLTIYELTTGSPVAELSRLDQVRTLSWSPDGDLIIIGGTLGTLSVWKVPETLTTPISKMIDHSELNYWVENPLRLHITSLSRKPELRPKIKQGVFTNSVVSLPSKGNSRVQDTPVSFTEAKLARKHQSSRKPDSLPVEVHCSTEGLQQAERSWGSPTGKGQTPSPAEPGGNRRSPVPRSSYLSTKYLSCVFP